VAIRNLGLYAVTATSAWQAGVVETERASKSRRTIEAETAHTSAQHSIETVSNRKQINKSGMTMKTYTSLHLHIVAAITILVALTDARGQNYGGVAPYTNDANTVLLDHFEGGTSASVLAYTSTNGPACIPLPVVSANYSYVPGSSGLGQALALSPQSPGFPVSNSDSFLKYPGGELLCQNNGTLECWVYLTNYLFQIHQFTYPGECDGDVGGLGITSTGQLMADMFYTCCAAIHFDSGTNVIPLNTWTHVALTWGSAGARLYINGALVGADPNTGSFTHWSSANSLYVLGSSGPLMGCFIDELRISNIQRTQFNLPCTTCPPKVDLKLFAGLIVNGPIGSNYNVQATGTLAPTNWTTLTNVTLESDPYIYVDYRSWTNGQQFYRLVPGP
jgi:hypothetical protein